MLLTPLEVLFVHPNFPGQFLNLARYLSRDKHYRLSALADASWLPAGFQMQGLKVHTYPAPEPGSEHTHLYARAVDTAVRRGQQAIRKLVQLKLEGYEPDLIYIHPGWGDGLFIKEVYPKAKVVGLCEYYYHARGTDVGFDPMRPLNMNDLCRIPLLNTQQLLALESFDAHISPTQWQRSLYPAAYIDKIQCLHEGINTDRITPNPNATFTLLDGRVLRAGDEVLTYVARGFEPYRGFHILMQALPRILAQRPQCQVLLVGDEKNHYGPAPAGYASWKEKCLAELETPLDMQRVHFTGALEFESYLAVLQVSRAHVYLTYPFVLSWSMLEAMAAGCLLVASDTDPVREVIAHEVNGLLFPFFDVDALVASCCRALAEPETLTELRQAAVTTVKKRYDFARTVLPEHLKLIDTLFL